MTINGTDKAMILLNRIATAELADLEKLIKERRMVSEYTDVLIEYGIHSQEERRCYKRIVEEYPSMEEALSTVMPVKPNKADKAMILLNRIAASDLAEINGLIKEHRMVSEYESD